MTQKPISKLITDFIEYCEVDRGLSSNTAAKYDYRLSHFLAWAKEHLGKQGLMLIDMDRDLIRKFRLYLNRQNLMDATQYNYMVTIRAFLKFLVKQDYDTIAPEKIELNKYKPSQSLKFLGHEQLTDLFLSPDTSKVSGLRDRAMLELLFSTGLRVGELAKLNVKDLDFKTREFAIIGKGGRRRVVFLSEEAVEWLIKYLDRRDDHYVPLFIHYSGPASETTVTATKPRDGSKGSGASKSHQKKQVATEPISNDQVSDIQDPDGERYRLSVRSIQRIVKKYVRQSGLSVEATPHTLRHSFATDLLMAGADLRTVQESLGHKNVATTQIYTHITNLQLKKAHEKFHGQWRKEND